MRMSILNTATTEQMGYGSFSFFVYTKSTDPYRLYQSLLVAYDRGYHTLPER